VSDKVTVHATTNGHWRISLQQSHVSALLFRRVSTACCFPQSYNRTFPVRDPSHAFRKGCTSSSKKRTSFGSGNMAKMHDRATGWWGATELPSTDREFGMDTRSHQEQWA
jgi:hypothetical protein